MVGEDRLSPKEINNHNDLKKKVALVDLWQYLESSPLASVMSLEQLIFVLRSFLYIHFTALPRFLHLVLFVVSLALRQSVGLNPGNAKCEVLGARMYMPSQRPKSRVNYYCTANRKTLP
jgi:hypothetical protein